tara:strand:+ start:113 stop:394 length:282 start_codon:yes stop_codon:yes gene_type:complete
MSQLLIYIIKFYKYTISPLLGNKCRFFPTCSEYFIEALEEYGFLKGSILGVKRILKCHPIKSLGGSHGIDFVPTIKNVSRWNALKEKESKNGQ